MQKSILVFLATLITFSAASQAHAWGTVQPADQTKLINEAAIGPVLHTAPRDQGDAGFCWAYSMSGLMEGEMKKRGMNDVVISPEYLALNHMPDLMRIVLPVFAQLDNSHGLISRALSFVVKRLIARMFSPEGSASMTEALQDMENIGAMPESVYKYKFPMKIGADGKPHVPHPSLQDKIQSFIQNNLFDKRKVAQYQADQDKLREDLFAAIGVTVPRPTDTFMYDGREYTPITFMHDYARFNPSDYVEVAVTKNGALPKDDADDSNSGLQLPKPSQAMTQDRALALIASVTKENIAVPMTFTVFEDQKTAEATGVFASGNCANTHCTKTAGGHAVLAVGEKTSDGSSVDALIVKNSWGQTGLNAEGKKSSDKNSLGFYLIKDDYLTDAQAGPSNSWTFVVPKHMM